MPFVTSRGGPLSGLEALSLQGLPLDRIILTSESQRDLQDLAGNAMTSTVICAAMLTALILGYGLLEEGAANSAEARAPTDRQNSAQFANVDADGNILVPIDIEDSPSSFDQHDRLLQDWTGSAQFCTCEGQSVFKKDDLFVCTLCGHRACGSCAGNPTHAYQSLAVPNLQRSSPLEFIAFLKGVLPMRLMLSGLSETDFDNLFASSLVDHSPTPQADPNPSMSAHHETEGNLNAAVMGSEGSPGDSPGGDNATTAGIGADLARRDFIDTVRSALAEDVRFYDIERSDIWTVIYEGEHSSMQLQVRPDGLQWLYFAKAPRRSPAQCLVREIFGKPIARMTPTPGSLLHGPWEIAAPISTQFSLLFAGEGNQVPAYPAMIGITKMPFSTMQMWTQIRVGGDDGDVDKLDADVRGVYTSLPDCGSALGSLYKKEVTTDCRAVYLFLDPSKIGHPNFDSYVFSFEHSRLTGYSRRITIAELTHHWRATDVTEELRAVKAFYRGWYGASAATTLQPFVDDPITYRSLQPGYTVHLAGGDCHKSYTPLVSLAASANALNFSQVLSPLLAPPTSSASWQAVTLGKPSSEMRDVAWAVQKIASRTQFLDWNILSAGGQRPTDDNTLCHTCDPPAPGIVWGRDREGRVIPYEDPRGAATYERAAKSKPAPFVLLRRVDEDGNAELRFALNIQSLAHQAYGRLVDRCNRSRIEFQWRLVGNTNDWGRTSHPSFTLLDNKQDDVHHQPPNFKLQLRQDQLRSLTWMVSQEAEDILPFVEKETEEALLPLMSWRAEVKVTMPREVRGGVLCDEVGYGKTAIILGLIDSQHEQDKIRMSEAPVITGQIASKATLLVVPHNVFKQWADEIDKFLGKTYTLKRISTPKTLSKLSVKDIREADIILVPWSIFNNTAYYQVMRYFTGTPKVPERPGRNFDSWFKDASKSLRRVVQVLQEKGPKGYLKEVWARRSELQRTQANSTYVPSRRLRGAAFVAAQAQARAATGTGASGNKAPDQPPQIPRTVTETGASGNKALLQPPQFSRALFSQTPDRVGPSPSPKKIPPANPAVQPIKNASQTAKPVDQQPVAPDDDSSDAGELDPKRGKGKKKNDAKSHTSKKPKGSTSAKTKQPWDDRTEFNIPSKAEHQSRVEDMKYLPLHAFSFNRVVVDEYTYTREERNLAILSLIARSKWILSGTPALDEFADVKDIARHLGIHLGIDNDGDMPTSNSRLKAARRNQTALEAFEMHQPPRSLAWYENRREHAQFFLNRFARQNAADTSLLPTETRLVVSDLLPHEKTIYQALYDRLVSDEGRVRKITGTDLSAQSTTLNVVLMKSKSPAEALLRCVTAAGMIEYPWSVENCIKRIDTRRTMSQGHWEKLDASLKMAWLTLNHERGLEDKSWETLLKVVDSNHEATADEPLMRVVGDGETADSLRALLEAIWDCWSNGETDDKLKANLEEKLRAAKPSKAKEADLRKDYEPADAKPSADGSDSGTKKSATRTKSSLVPEEVYQKKLTTWKTNTVLKDLVYEIAKAMRQVTECSRDIRFLITMQDLQQEQSYQCDKCRGSYDSRGRVGLTVIRSCGHLICQQCMAEVNGPADDDRVCVVDRCRAPACISKQVSGRSVEDTIAALGSSKLNSMVDIIKNIPADEKALLFVQFEDAMTYASRALDAAGIYHCVAKSGRSTAITDFVTQKPKPVPKKQQKEEDDTAMDVDDELDQDDQEDKGEKKRKRGSEITEREKNQPLPKVLILHLGSEMAAGL